MNLAEAQQQRHARKEASLDARLDEVLDRVGLSEDDVLRLSEAGANLASADVSPSDRVKLKGILKHYAKMKHPFTACVRDNTKRFGKVRAEKVCATLKDIIKGTTKWRKGRQSFAECPLVYLDDGVAALLEAADTSTLKEVAA